jgi:hypothetical protein
MCRHVSLSLILTVQCSEETPDVHSSLLRSLFGFYLKDNVMKKFLYRNAASYTMFFVFASGARINRFFPVPTLEHAT